MWTFGWWKRHHGLGVLQLCQRPFSEDWIWLLVFETGFEKCQVRAICDDSFWKKFQNVTLYLNPPVSDKVCGLQIMHTDLDSPLMKSSLLLRIFALTTVMKNGVRNGLANATSMAPTIIWISLTHLLASTTTILFLHRFDALVTSAIDIARSQGAIVES